MTRHERSSRNPPRRNSFSGVIDSCAHLLRRACLFALLVFLAPAVALADCTSPPAPAGSFAYNSGTYQMCDGTNWVDFETDGTLTGCAQAGDLDYDSGETAYKFCDGANWTKVGCPAGGGGGAVFTQVTTGSYTACGVKDDGTAWCWGANGVGQLGRGTSGGTGRIDRVGTTGTGTLWDDWVQIDVEAGADTIGSACGVRSNGTAWCWGKATNGQLGNGSTSSPQTTPVQVGTAGTSTIFTDWARITTGDATTCGLRDNGTVWCWGGGTAGQLGNGTTTSSQTTPVQVGTAGTSTLFTDWVDIGMVRGGSTVCGVRSNGTAWCWGGGASGQLGNGTTTSIQKTPVQVGTAGTSTIFTDWESVNSGGVDYLCGLRGNGTAWCWGDGNNGELGNGTVSQKTTPVQVGTAGTSTIFTDWTAISAGQANACGLRSNGTAWCWGDGDVGNLGNGTTTNSQTTPVQVGTAGTSTIFTDWTAISSNRAACGLRSGDPHLWCWGANSHSQIGPYSSTQITTPLSVFGTGPEDVVFTAPGLETWNVPAGITELTIEAWGAGGGAAVSSFSGASERGGGGGGGGSVVERDSSSTVLVAAGGGGGAGGGTGADKNGGGGGYVVANSIAVTPGEQLNLYVGGGGIGGCYPYTPGAGGAYNGGAAVNGGNAGSSTYGGGGGNTNNGNGGSSVYGGGGGNAAAGVAGTSTHGGNGGNGANGSGGGGTGGTVTNGSAGGAGASSSDGIAAGSGGDGIGCSGFGPSTDGGNGLVRITYTPPTSSCSASPGTCTGEGEIDYSGGKLIYCDGADWQIMAQGCEDDPDAFDFASYGGTGIVSSAIEQIQGLTCPQGVQISGGTSSEFRICDDASCSTVLSDWDNTSRAIENDKYLQLRAQAPSTVTVTIGTVTDDWPLMFGP